MKKNYGCGDIKTIRESKGEFALPVDFEKLILGRRTFCKCGHGALRHTSERCDGILDSDEKRCKCRYFKTRKSEYAYQVKMLDLENDRLEAEVKRERIFKDQLNQRIDSLVGQIHELEELVEEQELELAHAKSLLDKSADLAKMPPMMPATSEVMQRFVATPYDAYVYWDAKSGTWSEKPVWNEHANKKPNPMIVKKGGTQPQNPPAPPKAQDHIPQPPSSANKRS